MGKMMIRGNLFSDSLSEEIETWTTALSPEANSQVRRGMDRRLGIWKEGE